jgi:hypothetical protein
LEHWLDPKVKKWVAGVEILARIASRFPQTAYAGLALSLQAKWQYICRVVPGAEHYLGPIVTAICKKFIPALLQVSDPVDDTFRQLLLQGVKFGRLALWNPVTSAPHLHQSSVNACGILVKALHFGRGLNAKAHKACVREVGNQGCKARLQEEETYLKGGKLSGGRKTAKQLEQWARQGHGYRPSPIALRVQSCQGRSSKTTSPIATACALGAFPNAAMDATNPFPWSTGSAAKRGAL